MKSAFRCETGFVRESNQDAVFCSDTPLGSLPNLYIVADGMGGHRAGDIASQETIRVLTDFIRTAPASGSAPDEILDRALKAANSHVYRLATEQAEYMGMGTTFVGAVVTEKEVCIANVGDSRLYCLYADSRGLERITEDHSVVQELIKAGEITEEEAKIHPSRHMITRALGTDSEVQVDFFQLPRAGVRKLLLCSDGLTNMVEDEEIRCILQRTQEAEETAQQLTEAALAAGGRDNISVIILTEMGGNGDADER